MGYTCVTEPTTKTKSLELIAGKELTEASQLSFFRKKRERLADLFPFVDICDNGKIILKNSLGDFVTFE